VSTLVLEHLGKRVIDQFLLPTAVQTMQGMDIINSKHSSEMMSCTLLGFDSCCIFWSQNYCLLTQSWPGTVWFYQSKNTDFFLRKMHLSPSFHRLFCFHALTLNVVKILKLKKKKFTIYKCPYK